MGSCMWSSGSPRVTIAEPPLCMGERRAWQAMCHTNSGGVGSGRVAQPRNAKGQFERSVCAGLIEGLARSSPWPPS